MYNIVKKPRRKYIYKYIFFPCRYSFTSWTRSKSRIQSRVRMHSIVVCADFWFRFFPSCLMAVNPVKSGTVRWNWYWNWNQYPVSPSSQVERWYWHYRDT